MSKKPKYYSLDRILKENAHYNVIFGERSNGKTYAVLLYGLKRYAETGEHMAIVRRWQDDFKGKRGSVMFEALVTNGEVTKATGGEWDSIYYYGAKWYLARYDEEQGKTIHEPTPFCYAFAISAMEHDKSTSYPLVTTVLFDEFITRGYYIPDEFVLFMNVLSTIIRDRDNVKVFMCGNAVNKYAPYFNEMGISHIKEMEPGAIDVYTYGESDLRVAVEFSDNPNKNKASNVYFAFDNPKLNMITGKNGIWEIALYPHLPFKYKPADIKFTYFVIFNGDILQCEVIATDACMFTYVHRKTGEIKDPDRDIVFSPDYDPRPNWFRRLTRPTTSLVKKLYNFFPQENVYYQDNDIGEIMRNYLQWSQKGE